MSASDWVHIIELTTLGFILGSFQSMKKTIIDHQKLLIELSMSISRLHVEKIDNLKYHIALLGQNTKPSKEPPVSKPTEVKKMGRKRGHSMTEQQKKASSERMKKIWEKKRSKDSRKTVPEALEIIRQSHESLETSQDT